MRRRLTPWLAAGMLLLAGSAFAGTWDEPWHRDVVAQADSFGLFEVVSVQGEKARVRTLKTLAGQTTPAEFDIEGTYGGGSHRAHADSHSFAMLAGQKVYLLPKRVGSTWRLATPTAGIAPVMPDGEQVAATYRISIHQALQDVTDYEKVQACIFRVLHDEDCNASTLSAALRDPLDLPPGELGPGSDAATQALFFRQHVALEASYLMDRGLPLAVVEPFLQSGFFHQQVSAVRALSANREPGRDARIVAFIKDETRAGVARAMALFLAHSSRDDGVLSALAGYRPANPDADAYLPTNIMDPRVGTRFPATLGQALEGR